jgi:hypothetical protein
MANEISFAGFGPISSPKPTFSQGIGMGGSFAPIWTTDPKMPAPFVPSTISSAVSYSPWDVISSSSSSSPQIQIWPGLINGVMPANMFSTFTVDATSLWYIKATVDSDGSSVTGVTLNVDTDTPDVQKSADGELPTGFDVLVGLYKASMAYNIVGKNVTLTATQTFNLGYWAVS